MAFLLKGAGMLRKSRLSNLLIIVGLLIIVAQIGLNYVVQPFLLKSAARSASNLSAEMISSNIMDSRNDQYADVTSISSWNLPSNLKLNEVVGYIAIPKVHLSLPILSGATRQHLSVAAATISDNQRMGTGNYSVAGHLTPQADTLFSPLHRVNVGDIVYLTDKTSVFRYQIETIEVVEPNRVDLLDEKDGVSEITLVTCDDTQGKNRRVLKGKLVDIQVFDSTFQIFF